MEVYNSVNEQLLSQTKQSVLLDKVEFKLNENENNLNENKSLKQQYNFLKPDLKLQNQNGLSSNSVKQVNGIKTNLTNKNDGIPSSKFTICSSSSIQLEWKQPKSIGAGYINLGNTCFMNSVLQALTHCPPLVNYLLYSNTEHLNKCKVLGFCMTCELIKHIKNSYQNSGSTIRPYNIFQRLKSLAKHFQPGRQEDSHEFLRFVIDNIWKSCIINWENSHGTKLDNQSKETTFINQIFGGYHRSQVTCLSCKAKSDTYDYFMDFILDIKAVSSLEKALEVFIQPEILRNENAYKCSHCNKKVPAEKRFTVHRSPNVATFQLKRFDYNRIFGGKITKQISYPETLNLRPYMSENKKEPIYYKLNAVLVHLGSTSNSGHYFCYVRNSNNNWYLMDDSRVSAVSLNQVLEQQAYMLFYVRVPNKDLVKNSIDTTFKNHAYNDKDLISKNEKIANGKPNASFNKIKTNNKPNLPKIISETVNIKKVNGETKNVNKNENTSNRLAILSKIDTTLNNNLTSLKSTKNSSYLNNIIQSNSKPEEKQVKKLVPYDNNTSDEDSNSQQFKKQKVENNCSETIKEKIVVSLQNLGENGIHSEESVEKTDENSNNKKEEIVNQNNSIDYKHPSTSSIKLVKYFSPSKTETYSTNNLSSKINLNNQSFNNSKVPSTQSSWVVGELSSNKASSIASGSSTNSINSTTEWQVIDRDSSNLKKHLHKRTLNNSWSVATQQQTKDESLVESEKNGNIDNYKEDSELYLINKHKKKKHKHADEKFSDEERRLKKKLKKLKKKDKKKYLDLKLNPEALQAYYKQLKKKKKSKKKSHCSDDEEKKRKKHKKKHKKDRKRSNSSNSGSDNDLDSLNPNDNQLLDKSSNHQNKNDLSMHKIFFNNNFSSNKQSNVDKELHEMHFKLLGKNVNTWDGKKTQTDRELKEDFERDKKKSKNDNYNEEYDRGKVKKIKIKSNSLNGLNKIKQNSFQKFYEEQFMKNSVDKNKFIKSL